MEVLYILFGLLFFVTGPIGLIVAIIAFRRAGRLQRELFTLRTSMAADSPAESTATAMAKPAPAQQPAPAPPRAEPGAPPAPPRPAPGAAKTGTPRKVRDLEAVLGGQWLTWAGILALFFGSAFFLGVDLGDNVLSGWPQIGIGALVAVAFHLVGRRLCLRREKLLGLGLLGGGVALAFLVIFAAYGFHHLVPLVVTLPLLLVVATLGALVALRHDSLTIASLTLIGAVVTPVILVNLAGEAAAYDSLLPYLIGVNLGAVLAGLRRRWAGLPLAAFVATVVLVAGWWDAHPRYDIWVFLSVTGSWLVHATAPWLQKERQRVWSYARAAVLTANGLFFALFCHAQLAAGGPGARGGAIFTLAVIYVGLSMVMKRRRGEDPATRLAYTTGAALAAIAVPVVLDLVWVTVGWTALAAILLLAGLRERDLWQRATGLAILAIGLLRVAFVDAPLAASRNIPFSPLINGEFLAGVATLALIGWTFWAYYRYADRLVAAELKARPVLLLTAVVTLLWRLSLEVAAFCRWGAGDSPYETEPAVWLWVLLLWTVYGLAVILSGLRARYVLLRRTGYLILALAVLCTLNFVTTIDAFRELSYLPVLNLPLLQGVALTAALGMLAWRLRKDAGSLPAGEAGLRTPVMLLAIILLLIKISVEVVAYFKYGGLTPAPNLVFKSQLSLSVVWGLYAGVVIWAGFARRFKPVRLLGMTMLGITVLKVFLLDMQSLDRGYRIVAFLALGVLLLIVSLLYQRERRAGEAQVIEKKP
ncbi:MAG: DUF2339 domain-containing protein [Candidatus Krumholzibacteriota bacterium]